MTGTKVVLFHLKAPASVEAGVVYGFSPGSEMHTAAQLEASQLVGHTLPVCLGLPCMYFGNS